MAYSIYGGFYVGSFANGKLPTKPRQFAQRGEPPQRNCLAKRALAYSYKKLR
jgi:hypothetical protein